MKVRTDSRKYLSMPRHVQLKYSSIPMSSSVLCLHTRLCILLVVLPADQMALLSPKNQNGGREMKENADPKTINESFIFLL